MPVEGGAPKTLVAGGAFDAVPNPWRPDGSEIAVAFDDATDAVSVTTGEVRPLIRNGAVIGWSPDGKRLAYTTSKVLYVAGPDGQSPQAITDALDSSAFEFAWSPDSTSIVFSRPVTEFSDQIVVAPISGGLRPVTAGRWPAWSPDGQWITYATQNEENLRGGEIAVVGADGTGARTLTRTTPARPRRLVEVRRTMSGSVVSSFDVDTLPEAIAYDGARLALLIGRRIEIRTPDGGLVRTIRVPARPTPQVYLAGRWVVFLTGRVVRAADVRSGAAALIATARRRPFSFSVEGRRVAWAELPPKAPDVVRAVVLPR
jgi:hypothetical protein